MKIFKSDTEVVLKLENVKGFISACEVRRENIHYEITYFDGQERKKVWVQEQDFICSNEKIKIGFK